MRGHGVTMAVGERARAELVVTFVPVLVTYSALLSHRLHTHDTIAHDDDEL